MKPEVVGLAQLHPCTVQSENGDSKPLRLNGQYCSVTGCVLMLHARRWV